MRVTSAQIRAVGSAAAPLEPTYGLPNRQM